MPEHHRIHSWSSVAAGVILVGLTPGAANGQAAEPAPVTIDFPISCSKEARVEFDRAVTLLHHMTYPRARAAFQRSAIIDPRCAMAHWGIAMTLFQPLWPTRPGPEELRRGWEAVQQAVSLQPPTRRERLLVDAAAAFFRQPESGDYWERIRRWEKAMEAAHAAFPEDPEVAAFYALAHLAVAPADAVSPAHSERAAGLLLAVYQRNPDHPGAMHYLVHANDVPGRASESLEVTRRYETAAPRNPHALHMPTHIYTRLGDWEAVIHGNTLAADAALETPAGDRNQFVWDEFPHAVEYLVYAHLQQGADDQAAAQLARLQATGRLQPTFKTAFHLSSVRARYALERRAWGEAMALVPRDPPTLAWDRFTWPEAVTWFARGLGAAREGRLDEARAAADRLGVLETAAGSAGEALFARNIRILRLEVRAWLAGAERDGAAGVALMREAADLELATPKHAVTPAPTLPAHELLGDLFLEQARPLDALAAYRRSLELYPRRFNSLLGAARAARGSGDEPAARSFYQELLQLAAEGTRRSGVDEARRFVSPR
jgi:tetratricopeptide (TPR) repeat protein